LHFDGIYSTHINNLFYCSSLHGNKIFNYATYFGKFYFIFATFNISANTVYFCLSNQLHRERLRFPFPTITINKRQNVVKFYLIEAQAKKSRFHIFCFVLSKKKIKLEKDMSRSARHKRQSSRAWQIAGAKIFFENESPTLCT
jgi:hypothetical protein